MIIDRPQTESENLCLKNSQKQCKDKLCLQINVTNINCLSIDDNIVTKELFIPIKDKTNSTIANQSQMLAANPQVALVADSRSHYRYRPSNIMLFCIIILSIFVGVSNTFFIERGLY